MKYLILIMSLVLSSTKLSAQLYEAQPVSFETTVTDMYYDSVSELSYIYGRFKTVNDDTANVVIYDGTGYSLMPVAPVWAINTMIRYKDKIYAGGYSSGLAVWDGIEWSVVEDDVTVHNLRVINDRLYVMGYIHSMGGVACRGVGVWNDTVWSALPDIETVFPGSSGSTSDIAFYKGNIYVCCNFLILLIPRYRI